jgi:hypothetical protein
MRDDKSSTGLIEGSEPSAVIRDGWVDRDPSLGDR